MSQTNENHPSMSTQEKALMARDNNGPIIQQAKQKLSVASTVKNIASDLLELHLLENNGNDGITLIKKNNQFH